MDYRTGALALVGLACALGALGRRVSTGEGRRDGIDVDAIYWKSAIRSCDVSGATLDLLDLYQAKRYAEVTQRVRLFSESCGEDRPLLSLAYRASCETGDAAEARDLAGLLASVTPIETGWLNIACAPLHMPPR